MGCGVTMRGAGEQFGERHDLVSALEINGYDGEATAGHLQRDLEACTARKGERVIGSL